MPLQPWSRGHREVAGLQLLSLDRSAPLHHVKQSPGLALPRHSTGQPTHAFTLSQGAGCQLIPVK